MNRKILKLLTETRDRALAPYSQFKVGAVLQTVEGKLYTGHNIESSSYGLTICAERVALFKALSEGERNFEALYLLAGNDDFCPPCGACRQMLIDYAPKLEIVLIRDHGEEQRFSLEELLPVAFTPERLKKKT